MNIARCSSIEELTADVVLTAPILRQRLRRAGKEQKEIDSFDRVI